MYARGPLVRGVRAYISGKLQLPMLQVVCITSGTIVYVDLISCKSQQLKCTQCIYMHVLDMCQFCMRKMMATIFWHLQHLN